MPLVRDANRLFAGDAQQKSIAADLYHSVKDLPIISPHGHVEAELLSKNENFDNASDLFIKTDHYLTRVLHGAGFDLRLLGVASPDYDPRAAWKLLASHWHLFIGTPTRYWLEDQFHLIFGVEKELSESTAGFIYDQINESLRDDRFRPRELLESFNVSVLATTDSPDSDLKFHLELDQDSSFQTRIVPTLRPDALANIESTSWLKSISRLGSAVGYEISSFETLLTALRQRREFFKSAHATATDSGAKHARAVKISTETAEEIFKSGLNGSVSAAQASSFRDHFLYESIKMASEDGLVMQLHAGVHRNHHQKTLNALGPDTGHDLPLPTSFTEGLGGALNEYGVGTHLQMVLFSVDESSYPRDIAPLAGFYPSVFLGAPWWFLDHPNKIADIRKSTTPHSGFYKTSGFIDDTRALCSIPARHDMSRRVDSSVLAEMVASHMISKSDAENVIRDLVTVIPTNAFRLDKLISQADGLGGARTSRTHMAQETPGLSGGDYRQ